MSFSFELHWHVLQEVYCTGWNNCSQLKQTSSGMDVLFRLCFLRLSSGPKKSSEHKSVRKNQLLNACRCLNVRLSLREMDQKVQFGGNNGYRESHLEFFCHSKVFRWQKKFLDPAGAVRSQAGNVLDYCDLLILRPISHLLSHMTGLLFAFT